MEEKKIKPVSLKDLKSKESSIVLLVNGEEKAYKLRPVNLEDWVWMGEHFGQDPTSKLRKSIPLEDMAKMCYRLLVDKSDFLASDVEMIDDEGEVVTIRKTGPQKFKEALNGIDGIERLSLAFTECLGVSDISEDDLENLVKSAEKKTKARKK